MTKDTTRAAAVAADNLLFDDWSDAIEDGVRARVRGFIETMLEEELDGALSRPRYGRRQAGQDEDAAAPLVGCRHGHRERTLTGMSGKTGISVLARADRRRARQDQRLEDRLAAALLSPHQS